MRLSDKIAVVTGAGGGIGRAAAVRFAREGAMVFAVDINVDGNRETAELRNCGTAELRNCLTLSSH